MGTGVYRTDFGLEDLSVTGSEARSSAVGVDARQPGLGAAGARGQRPVTLRLAPLAPFTTTASESVLVSSEIISW